MVPPIQSVFLKDFLMRMEEFYSITENSFTPHSVELFSVYFVDEIVLYPILDHFMFLL